jgi:hypothetical protein
MTDGDSAPGASLPVPVAPASSLQGDAAASKAVIEGWIGDPQSPYWRGSDGASAASIRSTYQDLLRGELQGAAGPVGPADEVDVDLPMSVAQYDFSQASGAASMSGADRSIIDGFLPVAFAAGLGQLKVKQAIGWSLAIPGLTAERFKDLALTAGWGDRAIATCLSWYRSEAARRGSSGGPAAPAAAVRSAIAARKAEIEAQMWIGGKPNPAYFGGPLQQEYAALLRDEGYA